MKGQKKNETFLPRFHSSKTLDFLYNVLVTKQETRKPHQNSCWHNWKLRNSRLQLQWKDMWRGR